VAVHSRTLSCRSDRVIKSSRMISCVISVTNWLAGLTQEDSITCIWCLLYGLAWNNPILIEWTFVKFSIGIAQPSLTSALRWRWVVSFTPQPLYSWRNCPQYPLVALVKMCCHNLVFSPRMCMDSILLYYILFILLWGLFSKYMTCIYQRWYEWLLCHLI
jgi:hypothetical protein